MHNDIIKIYFNTDSEVRFEEVVHDGLKMAGAVCGSKPHYKGFILAKRRNKCSLVLISLLYADKVISTAKVKHCKNGALG